MIKIMLKLPEKQPEEREINSIEEIEELMEGEFEITQDDHLPNVYILVNEEARGIRPHNFTIHCEGAHDWVYGPAMMISMKNGQVDSLTERQINDITDYFSSVRPYK